MMIRLSESDEPELFADLIGNAGQGEWGLRVLDLAKRDVGVLTSWGLAITY